MRKVNVHELVIIKFRYFRAPTTWDGGSHHSDIFFSARSEPAADCSILVTVVLPMSSFTLGAQCHKAGLPILVLPASTKDAMLTWSESATASCFKTNFGVNVIPCA